MKFLVFAFLVAAVGSTAQARTGGGSGWTGVIVEKIQRSTLVCRDETGLTLRLTWVREFSNAGDGIKERHDVYGPGRGWDRGAQSLDVRGSYSSEGVNLELMNYGTRNYEGAPVLGTLKGELDAARFEGQIKMSHNKEVNGPLLLKCTLEQK